MGQELTSGSVVAGEPYFDDDAGTICVDVQGDDPFAAIHAAYEKVAPIAAAQPTLWWHVYSALIPDMCVDDDGNVSEAHALLIMGESLLDADYLATRGLTQIEEGGTTYSWLQSFDHEPSDIERETLTPEEYRD